MMGHHLSLLFSERFGGGWKKSEIMLHVMRVAVVKEVMRSEHCVL